MILTQVMLCRRIAFGLLCRTVARRLRCHKEHWNTHRIRRSRNDTIPGVSDVLYYLLKGRGGRPDLPLSVPADKISYVENHSIEKQEANEHFEYF